MLPTTVQQRATARLLRRALEAALPPPTKKETPGRRLVDAVADRVSEALQPGPDATLTLTEADAERGNFFRDRRRYFHPRVMRFDPYQELFAFRRVATKPWDEVWKKRPLVFHDVNLVHVFPFPPHPAKEPYNHVENVTEIIKNHPGPVGCLRVDSSVFPSPEELGKWMDLLSVRGVNELKMLDVGTASALEFPLTRLQSPSLNTLALGFVQVRFGYCFGFSEVQDVCLVCCQCSAIDLSEAVEKLGNLKSLKLFGLDLGAAGTRPDFRKEGGLDVVSDSLKWLELLACKSSGVTVRHAPSLEFLAAGVLSSDVKNAKARPPLRIKLMEAGSLEIISSLVLYQQNISFPAGPLSNVHTVQVAMQMAVPQQWRQLMDVAAQLPVLQTLELTREDERVHDEEVELQPGCMGGSLQNLILKEYRAGNTEVTVVMFVLSTVPNLLSVDLYPHQTQIGENAPFVHYPFRDARVRPVLTV